MILFCDWAFSSTIKWLLATQVTMISSFGLSLHASFRRLSLWLSLLLEKRSSNSKDRCFIRLNLFINNSFNVTFLLFLLIWIFLIIKLFLNVFLLFGKVFSISSWFVDRWVKPMFHPSMTHGTVHSSWTFRELNGLNFVGKVPIWAFFRLILMFWGLPSVILNVMRIRAFSSVMAKLSKRITLGCKGTKLSYRCWRCSLDLCFQGQ